MRNEVRRPHLLTSALCLTCTLVVACKSRKTEPVPPPVPAQVAAPAPLPPALDPARLPDFVDRHYFKAVTTIADRCQVDVRSSTVACKTEYFDNVVKFSRNELGMRDKAMMTFSYVLEHGTDEMKTAAVEFMSRAYDRPLGALPNPEVVRKLIGQLEALPEAQAIDAVPAITHLAVQSRLEELLFEAFDRIPHQRVAVTGLRHVMVAGRLRVFDKLVEIAKGDNLEKAVSAVEAPRAIMSFATPEETSKICGWMSSLMDSPRGILRTRAASYLPGCGPKQLDTLLGKDEKLVARGQPTIAGLAIYGGVCTPGEKTATRPTTAQCRRLRKLATTVLQDVRSREPDRIQALEVLAEQFPGKDTLALASRIADDGGATALSRKAQLALRDLDRPRPQPKN